MGIHVHKKIGYFLKKSDCKKLFIKDYTLILTIAKDIEMSKPVRTFTMGDIARDAEDIGIFYNRAIDFLSDDEICVSPEGSSLMMYLSDFQSNAYGNDEETIKIMLHFFNKHKITEFLITK